MSNVLNQQQLDLAEQLKELVKVGVGGKFKDTSDYTAKIQEELEREQSLIKLSQGAPRPSPQTLL